MRRSSELDKSLRYALDELATIAHRADVTAQRADSVTREGAFGPQIAAGHRLTIVYRFNHVVGACTGKLGIAAGDGVQRVGIAAAEFGPAEAEGIDGPHALVAADSGEAGVGHFEAFGGIFA